MASLKNFKIKNTAALVVLSLLFSIVAPLISSKSADAAPGDSYRLTYTAGASGSVTGTLSQTVTWKNDGTPVTAEPNANYRFTGWSDGITANPRTDTNVQKIISVTANFTINSYTATYTAGANGSITGTSPQSVTYGSSATAVTAVPNAGYRFTSWSDGVLTASRTDSNVTATISVTANFARITYTATYTAGAGGSITGSTPQTINQGANATAVTAVANTGYTFTGWSDGVLTATRTDTNLQSTISVTASFTINSFTATYTPATGGSITGSTPQSVNYGSSATAVTAVANTGYTFAGWSDGVLTASRTDTNVTGTISVTANFTINSYTATYTAGANGSITGTSPQSVTYGSSATAVTAVPNAGYRFTSWSDGVLTASRTDSNVTATISVTANFAAISYTLVYADGGATVGSAPSGGSYTIGQTFTVATPANNFRKNGYTFDGWSDGTTTYQPGSSYTVGTSNVTLTAVWALPTYTLTYSAGANGTITGTLIQSVTEGLSGSAVTAVANTGYTFTGWSDRVDTASRTDSNVTGNISVTANFARITFTATYTPATGGSITGSTPQSVNYGSSATAVTAVANTGYTFAGWSDGVLTASRTDTNVTANISVTANFTINSYTATYTAGANGSITGTSPQSVTYGSSATAVTAVANSEYEFLSWSDGVLTATRSDLNIVSNISVTANFIALFTVTYEVISGGSISGGSSIQTLKAGQDASDVTATPSDDYVFIAWSDGNTNATRKETNVRGNNKITANFAKKKYSLSYESADSTGGSISGSVSQTIEHGSDATTVIAVASEGYEFVKWDDNDSTNPVRKDTNVKAIKSAQALFAKKKYILNYSTDGNGSLTGLVVQSIVHGQDAISVTAVANNGYVFVSWSDGVITAGRTDANVVRAQNFVANFALIQLSEFTITYSANPGGSVSGGASSQSIKEGEDATEVTAIPSVGYEFTGWSDGNKNANRKESNVRENTSVTANFAKKRYAVSYESADATGGTITGSKTQSVEHGADGSSVTAEPATGYEFTGWSDGVTTATRTDTAITGGKTVTANFKNTFTLGVEVPLHGPHVGAIATNFSSGDCPVVSTLVGVDCWHFILPGSGNIFKSISVEFKTSDGIAVPNAGVYLGDVIYSNDTKDQHAWVLTPHGSGAILQSGTAVRDGSATEFVLSHTAVGTCQVGYEENALGKCVLPSNKPSTTVTQASTSSLIIAAGVTNTTVKLTDAVTVTGTFGTPTGNVTFYVCYSAVSTPTCSATTAGATQVGAVKTLSAGTATSDEFAPPAAGFYTFHAVYEGNTTYNGSADTGAGESFVVTTEKKQSTTVTQASTSSLIIAAGVTNTTVKLTDAVTVTGTFGTPTGNVTFYVCYSAVSTPTCSATTAGATQVGAVKTLSAGTATSDEFAPPAAGFYTFHAVYEGNTTYNGSADTGAGESFVVTTEKKQSTTVTQASTSSLIIAAGVTNTTVKLTDAVTVTGTFGTPTGNVTFYVCYSAVSTPTCSATTAGATQVGAVKTLSAGTATSDEFAPPAAGFYTFHAVYEGNTTYNGSADTGAGESFVVTTEKKQSTTVTQASTSSLIIAAGVTNTTVKLTDAVTVTGTFGTPTGNVTFYVCYSAVSTPTCSATTAGATQVGAVKTLSAGTATSDEFAPPAAGFYTFHAVYEGNTTYNGSADTGAGESFVVTTATPPTPPLPPVEPPTPPTPPLPPVEPPTPPTPPLPPVEPPTPPTPPLPPVEPPTPPTPPLPPVEPPTPPLPPVEPPTPPLPPVEPPTPPLPPVEPTPEPLPPVEPTPEPLPPVEPTPEPLPPVEPPIIESVKKLEGRSVITTTTDSPTTTDTPATPAPAPLALPISPIKAVQMTKEFVADTVLTKCGAPTTIDLTSVLSKMPGAKVTIKNVPLNGVMSQPSQFIWVFTPNANFCALGGNDQLVMQVVDQNGNIKVVQRNITTVRQGDIPSVIHTGFEDVSTGTQEPINSDTYPILALWLLLAVFTNFRQKSLSKGVMQ